MRLKTLIAFFLMAGCAATANAQQGPGLYHGFTTGMVGGTMGGSVSDPVVTFGLSSSVHESNGWGAEVDFSVANDSNGSTKEADITSFMLGANWIRPQGGPFHPYLAFGIGALGLHGCLQACTAVATTWDLGLSVGGGGIASADVAACVATCAHVCAGRPRQFKPARTGVSGA